MRLPEDDNLLDGGDNVTVVLSVTNLAFPTIRSLSFFDLVSKIRSLNRNAFTG